jgi:fermentation-respiration switch protein FrsA (DUF1100 family)
MEDSAVVPVPVRKRRARRLALRVLRIAVIVYLVLCVLLYFVQDWLVFPAAKSQGTADAKIRPERDSAQLDLRTVQGDHVAALFGKALLPDGSPDPQADSRPTILYFYGNGGAIAWSMIEFDRFRRLDANVLIPDFVGFGMSSGKPSEVNLYATADAAYDYLIHRNDIDPKKIVPMGWSIGGAVAIDLASRKPVAGLATFNAFTTMPAVARLLLPWFPTSLFLKYQFDNATKIAGIGCPILICNGLKDTLVPATMADELARLAKGPVTRVTVKSADHNTIFSAQPKDLFSSLQIFVNQIANRP